MLRRTKLLGPGINRHPLSLALRLLVDITVTRQIVIADTTTALCSCNPGYVPNGLACVLQGQVGGDLTLLAGALGGAASASALRA